MKRAYSLLTIKAVNEDQRIITGIATTPTADRTGDIVEPDGAEFSLPLPLLWQHDSSQPIGHVTDAKVTSTGIQVTAKILNMTEPGVLKDRLDEAWQSIKSGLVQGLSIGFKEIEVSRIEQSYSYRYLKWLWLELSAVTIPANGDCSIQTVKSIDTAQRAATGQKSHSVVRLDPPGASGSPKLIPQTPQEGNDMLKVAEQISALEAKRVANTARMEAVMLKGIEEKRSTERAEQEEFDNLQSEVETIDKDLVRFRQLEKAQAKSAQPVYKADTQEEGTAARSGSRIEVKSVPKLAPGIGFARYAKVKAISFLNHEPSLAVAERMYGADSAIAAIIKAAVAPGSNVSGNWADALTGADTTIFADFATFLRPATILGKFGQGGIPGLRVVPFRERLISQTAGGDGYWVGEGKPKPLTSFDFAGTTLSPLKVANIAVLTDENVKSSSPNSEIIVRDALRDALVATQDVSFIDPTNAGTANVKPASVTNGAASVASTGTDGDAVRLDIRALFQKFIDADNPPENGVWIMSTTTALAASMMMNALGQREFPDITMKGGLLEGIPVIASRYAGNIVAMLNASDIYEADEGDVAVDMSREASLEMKDSGLAQDGSVGTGASLVSLWQNNLVGLRAEKTINWKRRRDSAVAYLTGVAWGGAVPTI